MFNPHLVVTLPLCVGLLAGTASAQITPISEFPGTYQEIFLHELPLIYQQPCMDGGIFGGTATLCAIDVTTNQPGSWFTRPVTTGHSCEPGCFLFAKEPPQLFFSSDGAAMFEFNAAASRFGGYFGAVCDFVVNTGGKVTFYDESENVIDEVTMEFAACGAWEWSGWESTVPIKKVRIESVHEWMAGGNILMDDLRYDPADGGCEPAWDNAAGAPGFNQPPSFFKVYDDGSGEALYAGGSFTTAGGIFAERVARWDGTMWSGVGMGLSGQVYALAEFDDGTGRALYAGGVFTHSGGTEVNHIARWDGTAWLPVGSGMNQDVYALAVYDDGSGPALFAGGRFTEAGGTAASGIARWDGTAWSPVGGGVSGQFIMSVESMLVFDDGSGPLLYVGGFFDEAGGQTAGGIARWDGTLWSSPGGGISPFAHILSLAAYDDGSGATVYAGGALGLHRLTGGAWNSMNVNGYTNTLAVFDDGSGSKLYAGGSFTEAGGVSAAGLARWDGSGFATLNGELGGGSVVAAYALAEFEGDLYVGGFFDSAGGLPAGYIATWTGCPSEPEPCYANCDGSTTEPVLTVDDFTCFINAFAAAQGLPHEEQISHYANCDGSTAAPVLTVDDFTCFINAFAAGCP